ncbi:MAG: HD domain-containing protein [Chitinophagaceae bacterium]
MTLNVDLVDIAYNFAQQKHRGQQDDGGADYFLAHVVQVFNILRKVTDNQDILAAALLHDTLEDTETTYEELVNTFGIPVANLVMEVTHEGNSKDGYYFPRLHSQHGIMIKMADRLSNISRMEPWDEKRREKYLKKTKFWKSSADEAAQK